MTSARVGVLFGFVMLGGCASSVGRPTDALRQQATTVVEPPRSGRSSDILTADELLKNNPMSTAEGVRHLRPEFFRGTATPTHPTSASTGPLVYVNGVRAGGLEALETIPLYVVEEIRFIRPAAAQAFWGSYCDCADGVIHVRTRR
jgi:hypothetical protein